MKRKVSLKQKRIQALILLGKKIVVLSLALTEYALSSFKNVCKMSYIKMGASVIFNKISKKNRRKKISRGSSEELFFHAKSSISITAPKLRIAVTE